MKKQKLSSVKAVIFDAGGVLVLEDPAIRQKKQTTKLMRAYHALPAYRRVNSGKTSLDEHWKAVALRDKLSQEEVNHLKRFILKARRLNRPILEFALRLKKRGYKIGICSNNPVPVFRAWDRAFGFSKYFDTVIISASSGMIKPNKNIFRLAASKLGVKTDETLFIDDLAENVKGARSTGMAAVRFAGNQRTITSIESML